jgi:hypothetical protein
MAYRKSYSTNRSYSRGYSRRGNTGSYRRSSTKRYGSSSSYRYGRTSRSRQGGISSRTKNGYSQYYDRGSGSWKYTHRRVAEKKLGGRIRRGHEVHHINGKKPDNRPSNLTVISKSKHKAIHGGSSRQHPGYSGNCKRRKRRF